MYKWIWALASLGTLCIFCCSLQWKWIENSIILEGSLLNTYTRTTQDHAHNGTGTRAHSCQLTLGAANAMWQRRHVLTHHWHYVAMHEGNALTDAGASSMLGNSIIFLRWRHLYSALSGLEPSAICIHCRINAWFHDPVISAASNSLAIAVALLVIVLLGWSSDACCYQWDLPITGSNAVANHHLWANTWS